MSSATLATLPELDAVDAASSSSALHGFGLGLRKDHYDAVLDTSPNVDWFEIITENYLVPGGKPLDYLFRIRERYPMVMHGVSLSIGGPSALDFGYLSAVKALKTRLRPCWLSDHMCWTGDNSSNLHDLLPLPYTDEAVRYVAERVRVVQDFLETRILLENVSSYLSYTSSHLSEWEFLSAVAREADCLLLLDVNNVFVSGFNHEFDPRLFLDGLPVERIAQIHLAGHRDLGDYRIDTHDEPIIPEVLQLYADALERFGPVPTMIERDDNIPPLSDLLAELDTVRAVARRVYPDRLQE
jgi:hypothetical protein